MREIYDDGKNLRLDVLLPEKQGNFSQGGRCSLSDLGVLVDDELEGVGDEGADELVVAGLLSDLDEILGKVRENLRENLPDGRLRVGNKIGEQRKEPRAALFVPGLLGNIRQFFSKHKPFYIFCLHVRHFRWSREEEGKRRPGGFCFCFFTFAAKIQNRGIFRASLSYQEYHQRRIH